MKAKITADPRLLPLVARKMYSENPVVIATREMLQNSVDACKRAGVSPRISVDLSYNSGNETATIVVKDNGCGMTEEEIVMYFLRGGSSTKAGHMNETGRFGIGTGVVICADDFTVRSLNHSTSLSEAYNEEEIRETPAIEGTEIKVEYRKVDSWNFWPETLEMVAFSDVDVDFKYTRDNSLVYECQHVGLVGNPVELTSMPTWKGYGLESMTVGSRSWEGHIFVRLNGLVQHERCLYGNKMKGNILVDLDNHLEPTDPDFPMTTSREKLCGDTEKEVDKWLQTLVSNSMTTDIIIKRSLETPGVKFVRGKILSGKRPKRGFLEERIDEMTKEDQVRSEAIRSWIQMAGSSYVESSQDLSQYLDPRAKFPLIRLIDYEPSPDDIERDSAFINTWAAILELVLIEGVQFGVGLTNSYSIYSELNQVDNVLFFTINPGSFPEQPATSGQVLALWIKACHEAAHINSQNDHGEVFQATVEYIQMVTANTIYSQMGRLTKILGNY